MCAYNIYIYRCLFISCWTDAFIQKKYFCHHMLFIVINYISKPLLTGMKHSVHLILASRSCSPSLSSSPWVLYIFCTWICHTFIKVIPSLLSKLSSDVFLPVRLHLVKCPPGLSATTSSLNLFVFLCIWIKFSLGQESCFLCLYEGMFSCPGMQN